MSGSHLGRRGLMLAAAGAALARPALAQGPAWPVRPVRVVAPFAPGGSADTLGRLVATELTNSLGQSFVVENRGGAGGVTGSLAVARSAPDGYTFVISGIASHVIAPAVNSNAGFDPLRDFTHIAMLGGPPCVLIVSSGVPARNVAEFVALARRQPMSYGSPGAGTHGHLFGVALERAADIRMEHIPYRGAGQAMGDIISGSVPAGSFTLTTALGGIRGGTVRALAITGNARLPIIPDVPTFAEAGFPDLVGQTWFGLSGPAGLPEAVTTQLNREVVRIMGSPRTQERLSGDGMETMPFSSPEFTRFVGAEFARWAPIARGAGLTPE